MLIWLTQVVDRNHHPPLVTRNLVNPDNITRVIEKEDGAIVRFVDGSEIDVAESAVNIEREARF